MTITISDLSKFASRVARSNIGSRTIPSIEKIGESGLSKSSGSSSDGLGYGISKVLGAIWGGFSGFLFLVGRSLLSGLAWSFTGAFQALISGITFLANFDWNASDDEIDQQLRSQYLSWAATLGSSIGGTLGWFVCGILPNAAMFAFNPGMATYVLERFGEEAQEELAAYLAAIIRKSLNVAVATAFAQTYKTVRTIIKATPAVRRLFPNIDKWGAKDGPTFTFAKSIEGGIESIPNPFVRTAVDAGYDEFFDACIDAGFTLTSSMDSFVAMQKANQNLASKEILEVKPDREGGEVLYLAGSQSSLKTTLPAVLAQYQMIENRDIGDVFQTPIIDYTQSRAKHSFTLHINFHSRKTPPFGTANAEGTQRASVTIPNLSRSNIDWEKIKRAAGPSGYQYGRFAAICRYVDGRKSVVYANSVQVAVDQLESVAKLSDSEIFNVNAHELLNKHERRLTESQQRGNLFLYPQKAMITYTVDRADKAREIRSMKFELWPDVEPPDFKEQVKTLLLPPK